MITEKENNKTDKNGSTKKSNKNGIIKLGKRLRASNTFILPRFGCYPGYELAFGSTPQSNIHHRICNVGVNGNCCLYFVLNGLIHHRLILPDNIPDENKFRIDTRSYAEENVESILANGEYEKAFKRRKMPLDRIFKLGKDFTKGCGSNHHFDLSVLFVIAFMYKVSLVLYYEDSSRDTVVHWNRLTRGVEIRDAMTIKDAFDSAVDSSRWIIGVLYKMGDPPEPIHYVWMEPQQQIENPGCGKGNSLVR